MIKKNSGKIYRFKMDHDFGYGYAETYDFTDLSPFEGLLVYVYDKYDREVNANQKNIRKSGIALGPIRLNQYPKARGPNAWKYMFNSDHLLIQDMPPTKELQGLEWQEDNWNNFKGKWYSSDFDIKKALPAFVDYKEVRHLETRMLHSPAAVVKKFTMKAIIDQGKKVSDFYNLSLPENRILFVQLINTYYSLQQTTSFLEELSPKD